VGEGQSGISYLKLENADAFFEVKKRIQMNPFLKAETFR